MAAVFELQPTVTDLPDRAPAARVGAGDGPSAGSVSRPAAGRTTLVGLALVVLLVSASLASSLNNRTSEQVEASGEYHLVSEGETLYSVARSWNPQAPTAEVIERISTLNGGRSSVSVGEVLALPTPLP